MTSVSRLENSSNSSLVRGRKVERSIATSAPFTGRGFVAGDRSSVAAATSASNSAARSASLRALGSSISDKSTSYSQTRRLARTKNEKFGMIGPYSASSSFDGLFFLSCVSFRDGLFHTSLWFGGSCSGGCCFGFFIF